jgi:hypothetical protein
MIDLQGFRIFWKKTKGFCLKNFGGIIVFTLVTGVAGNFIYDWIKPKEQTPPQQLPKIDPQLAAQNMRIAASSVRSITMNYLRRPPPQEWLDAEILFKTGIEQYGNGEYLKAKVSFDAAYRIYNDLYSKLSLEGL